jgi:hypothetical protein
MNHSCEKHYSLRALEAGLFGLTFLLLVVNGKIIHRLPLAECTSTLARLQNLMADFMINHVVVFWAVSMYINMLRVQKKLRMGRHIKRNHSHFAKVTDIIEQADEDYLLKFVTCLVYLFSVAFTQNHNRAACFDSFERLDNAQIFTFWHIVITSVSIINAGVALVSSYQTCLRMWRKACNVESRTMSRMRKGFSGSILDDESD